MGRLKIIGGLAVMLLLVLAGSTMTQEVKAGPDDVAVSISGVATRQNITYSIVVSNKGTAAIGNIYVAGAIPTGGTFNSVVTTPAGAQSLGAQGSVVAWLVGTIPAGGNATFSYMVNTPSDAGAANAFVAWKSPEAGSAASAPVTQAKAQSDGAARRGCMACHYSVTLARESERGGPNHPKIANEATIDVCLGCHGAAADRTGMAPLLLRTIVHSAHINSDAFVTRYKGNCFTCHEISETGAWTLLYDKVELNKYNVPAKSNVNSKGYATAGRPIKDVK